MKLNNLTPIVLSAAALCAGSLSLSAATSGVVGATTVTLPAGGNVFISPYVNSVEYQAAAGGIAGQVLSLAGLTASAYDGGLYYLEFLDDTNGADGVDTTGLVVDIASNTATDVTLVGDLTGVNGDESVAIRKHVTVDDLFAGATGLIGFSDTVTLYLDGVVTTYTPDGAGGWLDATFFTPATDIIVPVGNGLVLINGAPVTLTVYGAVKETPTQIPVYGGNVVNILGFIDPVGPVDASADVDLSALAPFGDTITEYSAGTLAAGDPLIWDGTQTLNGVFFTPEALVVDETQAAVFIAGVDTTIVTPGNTVAP